MASPLPASRGFLPVAPVAGRVPVVAIMDADADAAMPKDGSSGARAAPQPAATAGGSTGDARATPGGHRRKVTLLLVGAGNRGTVSCTRHRGSPRATSPLAAGNRTCTAWCCTLLCLHPCLTRFAVRLCLALSRFTRSTRSRTRTCAAYVAHDPRCK